MLPKMDSAFWPLATVTTVIEGIFIDPYFCPEELEQLATWQLLALWRSCHTALQTCHDDVRVSSPIGSKMSHGGTKIELRFIIGLPD